MAEIREDVKKAADKYVTKHFMGFDNKCKFIKDIWDAFCAGAECIENLMKIKMRRLEKVNNSLLTLLKQREKECIRLERARNNSREITKELSTYNAELERRLAELTGGGKPEKNKPILSFGKKRDYFNKDIDLIN